jgi:hypothetical protein
MTKFIYTQDNLPRQSRQIFFPSAVSSFDGMVGSPHRCFAHGLFEVPAQIRAQRPKRQAAGIHPNIIKNTAMVRHRKSTAPNKKNTTKNDPG